MTDSYVLQNPDDLNQIEELGDHFFIFVLNGIFVRYFIYPSSIFPDTYNVYDNRNDYQGCYSSIVDAVNYCFNELKIQF